MLHSIPALVLFFFISVSSSRSASGSSLKSLGPCINKANQNNVALQKSFNQSWEPLGMSYVAFNSATGREQKPLLPSKTSFVCQSMAATNQKIDLNQVSSSLNEESIFALSQNTRFPLNGELGFVPAEETPTQYKSEMIKKDCIVASMKRNPGNTGYVCDYPGDRHPTGFSPSKQSVLKPYGEASGSTAQCVDDQMADYIHFSVNSAIQCLSGVGKIDSKTIFRKINNESAFNISVASRGGLGIAQITTSAVKEMTDPQLGKGRYVLDHVASSNDPSCNGFKDVAIHDLRNAPSTEVSNRCAWLSPGDGLARNLIYSIGYYLTMRDKYIVPALNRRSPELAKNETILNDLTSISYGAEGIKHVKNMLRKFRVNKRTNVSELRKKIRGGSVYLDAIQAKMKEVTCFRNGIDPSNKECRNMKFNPSELEGDSCVSPI
tara:strand:- start:84376 stop:85680 length:1305 start_codon:yes stop_codon:yes gene_type:complete